MARGDLEILQADHLRDFSGADCNAREMGIAKEDTQAVEMHCNRAAAFGLKLDQSGWNTGDHADDNILLDGVDVVYHVEKNSAQLIV